MNVLGRVVVFATSRFERLTSYQDTLHWGRLLVQMDLAIATNI
jgi:hypothetical protein